MLATRAALISMEILLGCLGKRGMTSDLMHRDHTRCVDVCPRYRPGGDGANRAPGRTRPSSGLTNPRVQELRTRPIPGRDQPHALPAGPAIRDRGRAPRARPAVRAPDPPHAGAG